MCSLHYCNSAGRLAWSTQQPYKGPCSKQCVCNQTKGSIIIFIFLLFGKPVVLYLRSCVGVWCTLQCSGVSIALSLLNSLSLSLSLSLSFMLSLFMWYVRVRERERKRGGGREKESSRDRWSLHDCTLTASHRKENHISQLAIHLLCSHAFVSGVQPAGSTVVTATHTSHL